MSYKEVRVIRNDTKIDRLLNKTFTYDLRPAYVEIGEDNICLPVAYKEFAEQNRIFQVRHDDIFIAGVPRSGTTWCQEMIWLIANDFDYEGAKAPLISRSPYFEFQSMYAGNEMFRNMFGKSSSFQVLDKLKGPRVIKTHLPWYLLPEDITGGRIRPKIIYILRNPKDVCVSRYYISRSMEGFTGTFDELCELFLAGRVVFGPFWKCILSYWNQRDQFNILFIRYRDMKEDLSNVIRQVASFLNKNITKEQVEFLAEHLSFENIRKNSAVNLEEEKSTLFKPIFTTIPTENKFIREGKQGGYLSVMTKELIEKFDNWSNTNLEGTDLVVD